MSHIKQIFLDLDGRLLDGKERHYYCYRSILEKFGFKPIGIDEYWEKKRALVNRRELLSLSGAEKIYDDFLDTWLTMIETFEALTLDKVQEGAIDCLVCVLKVTNMPEGYNGQHFSSGKKASSDIKS